MKGFLTSFRGRIAVISLITLAIGLTAYSIIVGTISLATLRSHINQDLMERGHMAANAFPGRQPGQRDNGPRGDRSGGQGQGQGQLRGPFNGDGMGGGPDGRPDGRPDQTPPPRANGIDQGDVRRGQKPDMQDRQPPFQGGEDMGPQGRPPGPDLRRPRFINSAGHVVGAQEGEQPFDENLFHDAMNGKEGFSTKTVDGVPLQIFATPWFRGGGQVGVVEVARDLREYNDLKSTQVWTWLALAPLALCLSAFGAFVLAGRAVQPLKAMESAATKMGQGDLSQRLEVQGDDELASLANTLNAMAGNLEKSFQDKQSAYDALKESYESQRRFTADASHELRTPLARLQLATSSALRGPESGYKEALETADTSAKSMAKLIRELLVLARADAGQLGLRHDQIDLRLAVSNALTSVEGMRDSGYAIREEIRSSFPNVPVMINGDQDHLERVVSNLLENALRHTKPDQQISAQLSVSGSNAILRVEDEGEGIAAADLPHLFERFYRADSARPEGGIGLGLAICKSVVEGHGGTITVQSEVGKGTRVEVALPVAGK